jgi:hypothetical protein
MEFWFKSWPLLYYLLLLLFSELQLAETSYVTGFLKDLDDINWIIMFTPFTVLFLITQAVGL